MAACQNFKLGILISNVYSQKKKGISHRFFLQIQGNKILHSLMNWLIWEKMLTYFHNKFRPENGICYIKCGVNN